MSVENAHWVEIPDEPPQLPELTPEPRPKRWHMGTPGFEAYLDEYLAGALSIKTRMSKSTPGVGNFGTTLHIETELLLNGKVISTSSDYRRIA